MGHVLIVDDEEAVCWALERALAREKHQVTTTATAERAIELAAQQHFDVMVIDVRLPGMDGLTALGRLHELAPETPVIVITAFGNLTTAVRAVEGGAFEYLAKPFDLDQALEIITRAMERPSFERNSPGEPEKGVAVPEEMIGHSRALQAVFKRIALVAGRQASVLITGESGTGKELVARAIHRHSPRRHQPFLPVHIAALNPSLVESELFGHVKGAFTGAMESRPGLLALANGGTIFLDELGDIPLSVQVKLLRVLEHNEVLPVGGQSPQPLDIRILSATHQDLQRQVADGTFRHDLFFRLNVFQIHLPPLRERPEDILPLAEYFLGRFEPGALPLQHATIKFLEGLPWFGNVRELRNALEHAAIVARGEALRPEHFPALNLAFRHANLTEQLAAAVRQWLVQRIKESAPEKPSNLYPELLRHVEGAMLEEVMRQVHGNRWAAAQWLGLNRATVRKKLNLLNLPESRDVPENIKPE